MKILQNLSGKKIIKSKTQIAALKYISEENSQREKKKIYIVFETLKLSPYLVSNKRTELSKIIFKICSQTLDIKQWQPWKYQNDFCVKCEKYTETMDHFVNCEEYGDKIDINWRGIKQNKKDI